MHQVSGKFTFQLTGANLTRDVKLIGSMNPYVILKFGDIKKTSAVNEKGGKNPKWCDKMEFHKLKENQLKIEVYNMRKLGLFDNDLIGTGTLDLCKYVQPCTFDESVPLFFNNSPAGTLFMTVIFAPDVQVTVQQGYLVQSGEIPLDMTVRIVSALLTRDNQWFGKMRCFYVAKCGDKKYTSTVCENNGKTPNWADKFQMSKKSDQKLTIDIQNANNSENIAYCQVPHEILSNFQPGVRTLPLNFQGIPAGQIFIEIVYNTYPSDIIIPVYQPVTEQYCPQYDNCQGYPSDQCQDYPPQYPPQQPQYPPQQVQYPPQQPQYPPQQPQYPPQQPQYPPQQPQYPPQQPQYPPQQQQYPPQPQNQYPPQPQDNQPNPYGHYPNLQQQYQQNQNVYNGVYSPPPAFG